MKHLQPYPLQRYASIGTALPETRLIEWVYSYDLTRLVAQFYCSSDFPEKFVTRSILLRFL